MLGFSMGSSSNGVLPSARRRGKQLKQLPAPQAYAQTAPVGITSPSKFDMNNRPTDGIGTPDPNPKHLVNWGV